MADSEASAAARHLVAKRWGPTKPVRLARELEHRVAELPISERVRLRNALAMTEGEPCPPTASPVP